MEKDRLSGLEKRWILYDVGNSAFMMLTATILPIYFNTLAQGAGLSEVEYLAYWGYAASVATMLVAIIGPVLGAAADMGSRKKRLFTICILIGAGSCAFLWAPVSWLVFLVLFIISRAGYNASLIFYDSMLVDITTAERMDRVSSHGFAWGYIGSCIPFVISLVFVLMYDAIGISMQTAMTAVFLLNAIWWGLSAVPLLRSYRQRDSGIQDDRVRGCFRRLWETLKEIRGQRHIVLYLAAFFFFIDGVYTIIEMATAYGSSLGLDTQGLLLALLVTQIVAFPCALVISVLSGRFGTAGLLKACILAYTGIALFAVQLDKQWEFWFLAVFVGMFQGGIQALARSYFAKIVPAEKSGEYFGIYDICGKGASFLGTTLTGFVAQATGNPSLGVAAIAVLFVIGYIMFGRAVRAQET
ncbi:MAG: MFS transporter [Lachnospiraceae bacterium]|jgi:UMF1 family MFS transporter|nr:MFS transporter [Lachnospiraceae bacterium]